MEGKIKITKKCTEYVRFIDKPSPERFLELAKINWAKYFQEYLTEEDFLKICFLKNSLHGGDDGKKIRISLFGERYLSVVKARGNINSVSLSEERLSKYITTIIIPIRGYDEEYDEYSCEIFDMDARWKWDKPGMDGLQILAIPENRIHWLEDIRRCRKIYFMEVFDEYTFYDEWEAAGFPEYFSTQEEIEKEKEKEKEAAEREAAIEKEAAEREAAIEKEAQPAALGWYCFIPGSGQPNVVHESLESAENEAARLRDETGQTVQILEIKKELPGEFNRRVKMLMSAIKADACRPAIERVVRLIEGKGIKNLSERDFFDDDWDWFIEHVPQD